MDIFVALMLLDTPMVASTTIFDTSQMGRGRTATFLFAYAKKGEGHRQTDRFIWAFFLFRDLSQYVGSVTNFS